ncbi:MAG: helix-turn-helix domain-containing protein, partial [Solirubrobacterales bacterium]
RREAASGVQALTPRERQVAELAAGGLSNPEIAARLFVTRKTVEGHMRTIFRKLDVSSRRELADLIDT